MQANVKGFGALDLYVGPHKHMYQLSTLVPFLAFFSSFNLDEVIPF